MARSDFTGEKYEYEDHWRCIYSPAFRYLQRRKQLTRALAKLARATSNEKLSQAFHAHLEETHGQIERIDQVVESESNLKIKRMKCVAMEGLIGNAANLLI